MAKLGSLKVTSYDSSAQGVLTPNRFQGVIVSCDGRMSRDTHIVTNTSWTSLHESESFDSQTAESKPRDQARGLLSVTFTRALRKNVKKRMREVTDDVTFVKGERGCVWLNEVCINIEPCDVIANLVDLSTVLDLIDIDFPWHRIDAASNAETDKSEAVVAPVLIHSAMLPLLYFKLQTLRLFIPSFCDKWQHSEDACVLQVRRYLAAVVLNCA